MPRGPRKLAIKFGATTLRHDGGVYLVHRFASRIGFRDAIAGEIRWVQRNNRYTLGEMLLVLLYPMILGLERIETTQLLRQNGAGSDPAESPLEDRRHRSVGGREPPGLHPAGVQARLRELDATQQARRYVEGYRRKSESTAWAKTSALLFSRVLPRQK